MIRYQIPPNVKQMKTGNNLSLSISGGGSIIVDRPVLGIWQSADNKNISEIIDSINIGTPAERIVALGCLSEAGLLARENQTNTASPEPVQHNSRVSIIIVSFNSQSWLADCIASIRSQSSQDFEIIIVDNASSDNTVPWLENYHPDIKIIKLEAIGSFAHALNAGVKAADGAFYLLLNPDVVLQPQALSEMIGIMDTYPESAAAASKLLLRSTPAFINGIGNYVGPVSWGTDLALGQLDLGQFDGMKLVPSACFAAALISAKAYVDIGPFDEGFPLYYEDSEWCYRARIYGYSIHAAPSAVGSHALGSTAADARKKRLSPAKIQQVVYGRLRFALKLLSPPYFLYFLCLYLLEDCTRMCAFLFTGRWDDLKGNIKAWLIFFQTIKDIYSERKVIQDRRVIIDKELFQLHKSIPPVLTWGGRPQLTLDIIRYEYLPKITVGQTRRIPEFDLLADYAPQPQLPTGLAGSFSRMKDIYSAQGLHALIHRISRLFQCYMMRV